MVAHYLVIVYYHSNTLRICKSLNCNYCFYFFETRNTFINLMKNIYKAYMNITLYE